MRKLRLFESWDHCWYGDSPIGNALTLCDVTQSWTTLPYMTCTQNTQFFFFFSRSDDRTDFLSMVYYVQPIFTSIKSIFVRPTVLRKETIWVKYVQKEWESCPFLWLHTSWSHCQWEDLHIISDLNFQMLITFLLFNHFFSNFRRSVSLVFLFPHNSTCS